MLEDHLWLPYGLHEGEKGRASGCSQHRWLKPLHLYNSFTSEKRRSLDSMTFSQCCSKCICTVS